MYRVACLGDEELGAAAGTELGIGMHGRFSCVDPPSDLVDLNFLGQPRHRRRSMPALSVLTSRTGARWICSANSRASVGNSPWNGTIARPLSMTATRCPGSRRTAFQS